MLLFGSAVDSALASVGDYLIDTTTVEKGLPNSSVTAIAQTTEGYLWVGTYNGLARFDGERFVKFYPENTPALKHARIRRLVTGPDGTLWISAHDGSITSYRRGQFSLEWLGEGVADTAATLISTRSNRPMFLLRNGEIIRRQALDGTNGWELLHPPGASPGQLVAEDANGVIWCLGRDQKIYRLAGSTFDPLPKNGGLEGTSVNVLTADKAGRIWAGTDSGFARWNGERFENMTPTNGAAVSNVSFLRVLSGGDVWTIANERLRKSRRREWVDEVEEARGMFTGWRERTGMHEDAKGGVWLYDYGRGLFHIRPDGRVRQLAAEENFPGERVDAFLEDREGNIWAGVDRGGLVRVREKRFSVLLPGESAGARVAVSVTEDAAGDLWIGTYGGGLYRWKHNEWQTFTLPGGTRRGFVFSVASDANGRLWTSAGDEDLYCGSAGKFTPFVPAVHGVKSLLRASDGRLWVGTKSGLGVVADGQFRQFNQEDGIARTDVRALAEDKEGVIWAGLGDGTLHRVASNSVTAFRPQDAWAGQPIWSVLADNDGSIWAGTFRGGLLRFRDGKFVRLMTQDGLPDDVICQLLDDGAGRLWAGTKQGIFRVEKAELNAFAAGWVRNINCTAYGRHDGLPSLECSDLYQPAAWRTRDGRLLFTTLKGVVSVRPNDVAVNALPPPVVIEGATVDGQEQKAEHFGVAGSRLEIAPGKHQIKIQFTGLSFTSPDRVRFKYKLEKSERDWSEPTTARWAQYSLLPPGEHRFVVTACNNDGVWNEKGAVLNLVVLPHLYETWTFKIAATVAVVGVVILAVRRIYTRRLRRQVEQLERQRAIERDRTRIAKDIHDDLGAGLTQIALLSELARRDTPEEMPHHVSQISEMARELTRNMDEIVWAVDPHNDTLESLVTYVSKFAQEYLSVAGIRCRLDVPAELPALTLAAEVRHNLFLAIKEALNNVVKHAGATEVWLRVIVQVNSFCMVVQDNGCGLARKNGNRNGNGGILGSNGRISSGHGLLNMERRLASIGGKCVIQGEPGQGTRAELRVELLSPRSPELVTGE
ncbi:MAG TPA: two-component regulator propeller domain-containing protein [Verrucomicrobiae bacterium]|nr:two-component regulator propeller domain-containing protein [Verrucomicrobiae bacterium]